MSDVTGLKTISRAAILEMLGAAPSASVASHLSPTSLTDSSNSMTDLSSWKVLVYDSFCRDVIAPLIKVRDLRDNGITLHMKLDATRQPVPEAPATYFIFPTEENVAAVAQDVVQGRYASYRINFVTQCPRRVLEALAKGVVAMPSVSNIYVYDRLLRYVALENDFFSLHMKHCFAAMNSRRMSDARMEEFVEEIAEGVCHILRTLNVLPILATTRSGVAEEVNKRVVARIQDSLRTTSASAVSAMMANRPVLLISDRNTDVTGPLTHPFGYGELLVDALGMNLNKIELEVTTEGKTTKKQVEVEDTDAFWEAHGGKDFSVVCELVETEINDFQSEKAKHNQLGDEDIASLMAAAPHLAEKKRSVDCHTTLSHAVLRSVRARDLDSYHAVATEIVTLSKGASVPSMDLLQSLITSTDKKGTWEDRLRILCLFVLCAEADGDVAKFDVLEAGILAICPTHSEDIKAALKYVKNLRRWQRGTGGAGGSEEVQSHWGWLDQKLTNAAKSIAKSLSGNEGLQLLPVTRIVDAMLCDTTKQGGGTTSKQAAEKAKTLEQLTCIDPKTKQPVDIGQYKLTSCIVFVVGGASYGEHYNLEAWNALKENHKKKVLYGGTDVLSGSSLLKQFIELGKE